MYPINDRQYIATCSEIAKLLSVSLSSAKKKVEIQIAKKGSKTIEEKRQVAQDLLKTCENDNGNKKSSSKILDKLMSTLENEDNFITED
jgi:polyhydroxyalkanoate synthesis regulator phasin